MVNSIDELDAVFHALSHGARRTMIDRLSHGAAHVGDLARPLSMSAPAVSKHLRVLERAGLVGRRRHGRRHRIHLERETLEVATTWLRKRAALWDAAFTQLDQILEEHAE